MWSDHAVQSYEQHEGEKAGITIVASGLGIIAAVFAMQYISVSSLSAGGSIVLPDAQSRAFTDMAAPTLALVLAAVAMSLAGAFRIVSSWKPAQGGGLLQRTKRTVAEALQKRRKVFWLALSIYAAVFLFASNTVVYSSESMSERYGVTIPSYHMIGCCGQPGSFPVMTVYLTENIGLLIIPANLILLAFLPLLVAVNAAVFVHKARLPGGRGFGRGASFCGVSAGVFAGCPVCAGSIFLSLAGGSAAFAGAAAAVAGYQLAFIAASVGALIAAPVIAEAR